MKTRKIPTKKTRALKKKSPKTEFEAAFSSLVVGHRPAQTLSPQDAALFRSFQSNLLSLISHELRTPLIGILNSLSVLDEYGVGQNSESKSGPESTSESLPGALPGDLPGNLIETLDAGISSRELIKMARRNAVRLQQALSTLLDLAELESGTFHARLREVDLLRMVRSRIELQAKDFSEKKIQIENLTALPEVPVLGDAVKLGRALDLCLESILMRAAPDSTVQVRISSSGLEFIFQLPDDEAARGGWDQAWSHGLVGFEGGIGSPASVFGGVLQSEQEFLSRMEEGFGSELILIHEILRLHRGKLEAVRNNSQVTLSLRLLSLLSEDHLEAVLISRTFSVTHGVGSVVLILIQVPEGKTLEEFRNQMKASLFRASDAAYALPSANQIALVLDDLKATDVPGLMGRIQRTVGKSLKMGYAHCPADVLDPTLLVHRATARMKSQTG